MVVAVLAFAATSAVAPSPAAAAAPATDVMFLFDTSGSMTPVLGEAKEEIETVISKLSASVPNVAFGVANVEDYPGYYEGVLEETKTEQEYEEDPEKPWRLDQAVTSEQSKVLAAIEALSGPIVAHYGGDAPEAYGRALWETDTNPNVGWRSGARHLIVLVADQVPHNANVDEGIAEEFWAEPAPWDTGEELPGKWGIPGTQLKEGETLSFDNVLRQLASDGKPLEMVDYHDTEGDFIHYWEHWASLAGGQAFEASEAGHEFAAKLTAAVENAPEDTACATAAIPTSPSPATPGGLPTALTPRFLQSGTTIDATPPSGKVFCAGQQPALAGSVVTDPQVATPSQLTFEVPATAASGLELTSLGGVLGPEIPFEVDDFRYPWGFNIINGGAGTGDDSYDEHVAITREDLESVFSDLGGPGAPVYDEAKKDAEEVLTGGLCYGFGLLSSELYLDAHGVGEALGWSRSPGFTLSPGSTPYGQQEASSGSHALTHALLRAAVSQFSPEAKDAWNRTVTAGELETQLNDGFHQGHPVLLLINWKEGGIPILHWFTSEYGHTLLAYNYQRTAGGGLNVDVVDPNVPLGINTSIGYSPQSEAYEKLQVHVSANGSWTYLGSFSHGLYGNPVGGEPGSLEAVPSPQLPGGLHLPSRSSFPWLVIATPAGSSVSSISYSRRAGHGVPADVELERLSEDAVDTQLLVPSKHHTVTVTLDPPAGGGASASFTGHGFLDNVHLVSAAAQLTLESTDGALTVPVATGGTELDVTRITNGMQTTVEAQFAGRVNKPTLSISPSGEATLVTSGGSGHVSISLATYAAGGARAYSRPQRLALHGRFRIHRHAPKIKHRRKSRRK